MEYYLFLDWHPNFYWIERKKALPRMPSETERTGSHRHFGIQTYPESSFLNMAVHEITTTGLTNCQVWPQPKEHCMCIEEKQNISSQSISRNLSHFYTPFWYLWTNYIELCIVGPCSFFYQPKWVSWQLRIMLKLKWHHLEPTFFSNGNRTVDFN